MPVISKDNRIVVQEKFTELEISSTIKALEIYVKVYQPSEIVQGACQKVINKLNKAYK
jgi:hypothetical protein